MRIHLRETVMLNKRDNKDFTFTIIGNGRPNVSSGYLQLRKKYFTGPRIWLFLVKMLSLRFSFKIFFFRSTFEFIDMRAEHQMAVDQKNNKLIFWRKNDFLTAIIRSRDLLMIQCVFYFLPPSNACFKWWHKEQDLWFLSLVPVKTPSEHLISFWLI